jgi:UDP-glucose 4-epimerase
MASIYLAYLLKREPIKVTGSLMRFRDFVYIDDVVDAWMRAIDRDNLDSDVYNIGSGVGTTVGEILRLLIEACGLNRDYPIEEMASSEGDQFGLFADPRHARKDLGWSATMPLPNGVARMVAWAKERVGDSR